VANPPLAAERAPAGRVGRAVIDRDAAGAAVIAIAIPFLFLHARFQPDLSLAVGSTSLDVRLSDLAALVVVLAALVRASRSGFGPLRAGRGLWLTGGLLLAWLAFETVRPVSMQDDVFASHVVSALKLAEYALIAVAVPLIVRRVEDLTIVLAAAIVWCVVATAVAVIQFFGLDIFEASSAGWRYPSFLGRHDFAALAAIAASLAAAGIVARKRRTPETRLFVAALAAGVLGLVLAGSVTAAGGLVVGAAAVVLAGKRRFAPSVRQLLALVAVVAVVGGGVVWIRSSALDDFLGFVGIRKQAQVVGIESYSQRTVLAYIGLRIFEDHPLVGVGWQRSDRPAVFERYLADAHRRFPDVVPEALPSPEHPWGVQNLYVQMLADAGVVGLVLLLAVGASGLVLAWRTAGHASTPWAVGAGLMAICGILTLAGAWASLGIVPGIPLQAATSLLLGLAAAGAATVEDEANG
jgi:O-antigen ligase